MFLCKILQDHDGVTAAHIAVDKGSADTVEALLNHQNPPVDFSLRDNYFRTPLHWSAIR